MKKKDVKVAIIDSGIESNNSNICYDNISFGWTAFGDFVDKLGHGTNVTGIIQKHSPNVHFVIIKVFNDCLVTKDKYIVQAFKWCIEHDIHIINLSVSITDFTNYYPIKEVCDEAYRKGIVIVAAAENTGKPCIPAYFEDVVGIGGADLKRDDEIIYIENSSIKFYGKMLYPNFAYNNKQKYIYGTSFATANFTGMISNFMYNGLSEKEIFTYLKKKAQSYQEQKIISNDVFDFCKNTRKVCIRIKEKMIFNKKILMNSSILERFIFSFFKNRIRNFEEKNNTIYNLVEFNKREMFDAKYYLHELKVSHIFRNQSPAAIVLNTSLYKNVSLFVQNYITDYACRNGYKIKNIVKENSGLFFKDFEYSYGVPFKYLDENEKYLLIKVLIDSICHQNKNNNFVMIEIIGNVFSNTFKKDVIDNLIVLQSAEPAVIVVVGDRMDVINKTITFLKAIQMQVEILVLYIENNEIMSLVQLEQKDYFCKEIENDKGNLFKVSELELLSKKTITILKSSI